MKLHCLEVVVAVACVLFSQSTQGSPLLTTASSPAQKWFAELSDVAKGQLFGMSVQNLEKAKLTWPQVQGKVAVKLGKAMFFDTGLSADRKVSCATCHNPSKAFADGLPLAKSMREDGSLEKNTPTLAPAALLPFLLWNGAKDSVYAQVSVPLFNPREHGLTPALLKDRFFESEHYAKALCGRQAIKGCKNIFSAENVLSFVSLQLEAFVAGFSFSPAKLDYFIENAQAQNWVMADKVFSEQELSGLKIFLNQGLCVNCHSGPLLSDAGFHNIGVPLAFDEEDQSGWIDGSLALLNDQSNCKNRANQLAQLALRWKKRMPAKSSCENLRFLPINKERQIGAFRTPALRNVALTAPYMHGGQYKNLDAVVTHYTNAISFSVGDTQLIPLNLTDSQRFDLAAFLSTLNSVTIAPE